MIGLSFEQAEKLVKQRRAGFGSPKVCFRQGIGNVQPKDLPFVRDAYLLGSDETRALIDNFNSLLNIKTAKRLSAILKSLGCDELDALLKKEVPKLYSAYDGRLTYDALHTLIDFRTGKLLEFGELANIDPVIAKLEKKLKNWKNSSATLEKCLANLGKLRRLRGRLM